MQVLKTIGWIVLLTIAIDATGFVAWTVSGQHPVDQFYIGTITAHTIKAIW